MRPSGTTVAPVQPVSICLLAKIREGRVISQTSLCSTLRSRTGSGALPRAMMGTLLILTIGVSAPAAAQSGSGVAAMEGTVTDAGNQPIAAALVTILSTETGYERSLFTDARGRYFPSAMPVGTYLVQASSAGFARARR